MIQEHQYRSLGVSGIMVSPLGVGTNQWEQGKHDEAVFQLASSSTSKSGKLKQYEVLQETLYAVAHKRGKSVSQFALNWLLRRDKHVIPIPGATSAHHALEIADTPTWNLDDEEFAAIDQASSLRKHFI
jgi:aryl-alcohol dehydrogenase-like predicted oxidoreductase